MYHEGFLRDNINYIQIETGTQCNYKCITCPQSFKPRELTYLSLELIDKIVEELKSFPNIRKIYLNGYDEPTLNPNIAKVVNLLKRLPCKLILLSNGSFLTHKLLDDLRKTGANIEIDIHLAAVNEFDFKQIHKSDLFHTVMDNLKDLKTHELAKKSKISITMVGRDSKKDNHLFYEMTNYFADYPFVVRKKYANDRAGLLKNKYHLNIYNENLRGCWLSNRPEKWIHITANNNIILCPEDYKEKYILGNLNNQTLSEIIGSEKRRIYRQWTSGEMEAPTDYICRRCLFATLTQNEPYLVKDGTSYTFIK